ncbi:S-layer homology domain-containing protein [Sporobacter termitidis DSM 10068]|uniref:S-layer homology domain-containing protein n=1 Tax=Sporobacter termitidis DSM 10068 TaxID=1123282 RepID=A0A1M5T9W0_9FIRM|nr:S-layer homology domain-containing protein [Sporobacter termitidis]SHH47504.1 S-layer homology domain-containing protein [Sporobacter termitidis DSM 10068]
MIKKALAILLALVLSLSLLPARALAAETADTDAGTVTAFEDVAAGAWYYDAVQYAARNGLMGGTGDKSFAPGAAMTRAMLVTVLYRLDGSPETDQPVKFTDVIATDWYYGAVGWAAENGITTGYSNGAFGAGDNVTRQQTAVMFQRYAAYTGRGTENTADLSAYTDASAIADWAQGAMTWAVSAGLLTGTENSALLPDGSATRAQTATVLMRYMSGLILENRTDDYISQFIEGDFGDFYADSSAQLRQSISQEDLLKGWNTVLQVAGAPGESLGSVYLRQNGHDVVVSSLEGTLYNITVTISYGADGRPDGIWTSYAPKEQPQPQSSDQWFEAPVQVGEKELNGMLTLPRGAEKPPVVILIQGSGASDMNEAVGTAPNRPFEDIAHGLAEQGVATLRYNKSTYQNPAGGGATIQYEMLDDAAAAVKLLGSDGRVDANRIYLLGHSLGGMMAPKITADNPQIKGFISLAGSLRSLQDIMLDQVTAAISAQTTLTEQEKSDLLAQNKTEIEKTKTLDDGGTGAILGVPTSYWKSLNDIDSIAIVKTLDVPMLILQGGADFQVYPDKDYKLWQTTLSGRGNVTFKLYDGLSHLFMPNQLSENGVPDASVYNPPNHVDAQVITDIAAWVGRQ